MKSIWSIICIVALANLVAIAGFVGFLGATDRLSIDRFNRIKTMLAQTNTAEKAQSVVPPSPDSANIVPVSQGESPAATEGPSLPSAVLNKRLEQLIDQKQLSSARAQADLKIVATTLAAEFEKLEQARAELERDRAAFEADRKRIAETEGSEQFKKSLETIKAMKAADAKAVLSAMLASARTAEVVGYLDQMDERQRAKVLTEFKKDSPAVAADLLERMRTRGIVVPGDTEPAAGEAEDTASAVPDSPVASQ